MKAKHMGFMLVSVLRWSVSSTPCIGVSVSVERTPYIPIVTPKINYLNIFYRFCVTYPTIGA